MKRHDQQTYFLFGAVAIALGGYLLYELLSRIYLQLFGPTVDGILCLGFVFSIWAVVGISNRQKRMEISLTKSLEDKLTEFENRFRERERKVATLENSDTQIRNDTSELRRWLQAHGEDIRDLKRSHKRILAPPLKSIEEAILEIATEVGK